MGRRATERVGHQCRATFEETVRTLSEEIRSLVEEKMEQIVKGVCESLGASYDLEYQRGYPPLVNHAAQTEVIRRAIEGSDRYLVEMKPIMGGEDFAYYLQELSGCCFFVGQATKTKEPSIPTIIPSSISTRIP